MGYDRDPFTELNQQLNSIYSAWGKGGWVHKAFLRNKQAKKLLEEAEKKLGIKKRDVLKVASSDDKISKDKDFMSLIMDPDFERVINVCKGIKSGKILPFYAWCRLRKINEMHSLLSFDEKAQVISLSIEAAAMLLTAEETRTDAYIKGEGEVCCWKSAAQRALDLVKKAFLIAEKFPDIGTPRLSQISNAFHERVEKIMCITKGEYQQDKRYRHIFHDPQGIGPVWVPYSYEPALADKDLTGEQLKITVESLGLMDFIDDWLKSFLVNI